MGIPSTRSNPAVLGVFIGSGLEKGAGGPGVVHGGGPMQRGFSWGTMWEVIITLRLRARLLRSCFPRLLLLGEGILGLAGSLKGGSVARVTACWQEALPLVDVTSARRDNRALFWGQWDQETPPRPPFSDTRPSS